MLAYFCPRIPHHNIYLLIIMTLFIGNQKKRLLEHLKSEVTFMEKLGDSIINELETAEDAVCDAWGEYVVPTRDIVYGRWFLYVALFVLCIMSVGRC